MLYPQNLNETLKEEVFRNPGSEYRGAPFWAWNCELDKEDLVWQIEQLKEMGFGGFHMHSRCGMATKYLSEDFFALIGACVSKAEQEQMYAYLYDEDRWPSGAAGGFVTSQKKYVQRNLHFGVTLDENIVPFEEAVDSGKPYFLSAYDVRLNEHGEVAEYTYLTDIHSPAKEGTVRWYANIYASEPGGWFNNQSYVDTLSKEAIDTFIQVTHEAYKREFGDKFGEVIPSIFTDEPQFTVKGTLGHANSQSEVVLPWTFDFDKTFYMQYGYSIVEKLPELFWELPNQEISVARYHYHDYIAKRFTEAFAQNCGEWCERNKLLFTGHVMGEESLGSQTASVGETMRIYKYFGIPGMDILRNGTEFTTAKQVQSVVRQYGKAGMASELYGVTNWDFDFRGHKFQGDWQAAIGVTLRVPHLSWVSMKGDAKRDFPATINYQSPWYKKYKYVEDHYARLNTALTRGKPIVNVAVIHPIESYWLHWGPAENTALYRNMLDMQFKETNEWLLSGLIDFDYISESLLPEQAGSITEYLEVGKMRYSTVVVSGCETLRSTTLRILEKFKEAGGKIIFVGEAPKYVDAVPSKKPEELYKKCKVVMHSKSQLLSALENERFLDIREQNGEQTSNLLYQCRKDNDGLWLFIAHMKEEAPSDWMSSKLSNNYVFPFYRTIIINGEYTPVLYDTLTGEIRRISYKIENGKTIVYHTFFAQDSILLKLCNPTENSFYAKQDERKIIKHIRTMDKVNYTRSEENVLLLDIANYKIDNEDYHEKEEIRQIHRICCDRMNFMNNRAQPWVLPKEEITHTISVKYEFESEIEAEGTYLATEDAEVCKIIFNGQEINNTPAGYFTDKSISKIPLPVLRKGINVVEVTYPFGERTFLENCFILGDFNVKCEGCVKTIFPASKQIGFGDIVPQGLPFYGANIAYEMQFETTQVCDAIINVTNYVGTVISVSLDGKEVGTIAYSPYDLLVEDVSVGTHCLHFTLYGNRHNSFGQLHMTDDGFNWHGPEEWERNLRGRQFETANEFVDFKYEYSCKPVGIMGSPEIKLLK